MASCFGQSELYALEITTSQSSRWQEIYGRFNFGAHEGVFRFCNTDSRPNQYRVPNARYYTPKEDFVLNIDRMPSEQDATWYYRWRGKETGEDVTQLGEDGAVYKMEFSEGGKVVRGTWGTMESDPGPVNFTRRKVDGSVGGMDIDGEWQDHDQKAYDKANRDRWR